MKEKKERREGRRNIMKNKIVKFKENENDDADDEKDEDEEEERRI